MLKHKACTAYVTKHITSRIQNLKVFPGIKIRRNIGGNLKSEFKKNLPF